MALWESSRISAIPFSAGGRQGHHIHTIGIKLFNNDLFYDILTEIEREKWMLALFPLKHRRDWKLFMVRWSCVFKVPLSSSTVGLQKRFHVSGQRSLCFQFVQITHCLQVAHGQASKWSTGSAAWCMSGFPMWLRLADCNPLTKAL